MSTLRHVADMLQGRSPLLKAIEVLREARASARPENRVRIDEALDELKRLGESLQRVTGIVDQAWRMMRELRKNGAVDPLMIPRPTRLEGRR